MRTILLGAAALLLSAAPAFAADATLKVEFKGLSRAKGAVMAALYDEAGYAAKGGKAAAAVTTPISGPAAAATFTGLAPGRYGLKVFHDVNGDGKMNTNAFGMPTEPVAFSNNAPMRFGPAKWADAMFEVRAGENLHTITIR